jgi:hypothetical protein
MSPDPPGGAGYARAPGAALFTEAVPAVREALVQTAAERDPGGWVGFEPWNIAR